MSALGKQISSQHQTRVPPHGKACSGVHRVPRIISAALHRKDGNRVVNYAQWKNAENWENLFRIGSEPWFCEMAKYAKPDAHLYEVCYLLDKTGQRGK
jgi:hypothetical protein